MRIAIYHNLLSGGAKRSLYEQVRRLHDRHQFDVFTLSSAKNEFADIRPFVSKHRVFEFESSPLFNSPFGRLNQIVRLIDLKRLNRLGKKIAAAIDAGAYDLLYVQPCQYENSPSVLSYLTKTGSIFYCQEPLRIVYETIPTRPYDAATTPRRRFMNWLDPLPGLYRKALRRNDRWNIHHANRVLVNSEHIQGSVHKTYGIHAEICYLGVDATHFRSLGIEREKFLLSVGSLTPLKGFDFVIEAISEIPSHLRPELVIASNFQNPPEKAFLEKLANDRGLTLTLLCNISEEELVELYNKAYLTVYAPIREPFGFVSIESMACETPIVAVNEGGLVETIRDHETGLLVERDPKQFANAICRLLENPDLAREMGRAGRSHVLEHWTWERSIDVLDGHFTDMVGGNR